MPVKERALLAEVNQVTIHDTQHNKSMIHKEKGQYTLHDNIYVTDHDERLISILIGKCTVLSYSSCWTKLICLTSCKRTMSTP